MGYSSTFLYSRSSFCYQNSNKVVFLDIFLTSICICICIRSMGIQGMKVMKNGNNIGRMRWLGKSSMSIGVVLDKCNTAHTPHNPYRNTATSVIYSCHTIGIYMDYHSCSMVGYRDGSSIQHNNNSKSMITYNRGIHCIKWEFTFVKYTRQYPASTKYWVYLLHVNLRLWLGSYTSQITKVRNKMTGRESYQSHFQNWHLRRCFLYLLKRGNI